MQSLLHITIKINDIIFSNETKFIFAEKSTKNSELCFDLVVDEALFVS